MISLVVKYLNVINDWTEVKVLQIMCILTEFKTSRCSYRMSVHIIIIYSKVITLKLALYIYHCRMYLHQPECGHKSNNGTIITT